jgi:hypothetical protein
MTRAIPTAVRPRTDTDMDHTIQHSPNGSGHEQSEVNVRTIVVSLAFLLLGAFLSAIITVGIFRYLHNTYKPDEAAKQAQPQIPPEPRIEVAPAEQIQTLRAHEDHILTSYSWVDQKSGTVRVPIDRAIDMLAQKGLPAHDYMSDILAGRRPPPPQAAKAQAGGNAGK